MSGLCVFPLTSDRHLSEIKFLMLFQLQNAEKEVLTQCSGESLTIVVWIKKYN